MSDQERDEILGYLRWIQGVLKWLGGAGFVFFAGLVIVIVSDHYEQTTLSKEVQWMRPRVESLWYKSRPSANSSDDQLISKAP